MIQQASNGAANSAIAALRWNLDSLSMRPADIHPPEDIRELINAVEELPPLPETAVRLLHMMHRPDADASDLAAIVELDPLVAAQMVRWANSAYYALRNPVESVREAIARVLGFEQALSLALALTTLAPLEAPRSGPVGRAAVWRHAVLCSRVMIGLRAALPEQLRPGAGATYLAGLSQNIGYLLLGHLMPAQFAFLNRIIAGNPGIGLPVVESFSLGIDHTQLGFWLMDTWEMPFDLCTAVRHHHNPAYEGPHQELVLLTCLADWLVADLPTGLGPRPHEAALNTLMRRLGLDASQCVDALARAQGDQPD